MRNVLGRSLVKDRAAEQIGRFASHKLADFLVDAEHPPGLVDLGDAYTDIIVGGGHTDFVRTELFVARNSGNVRGGGLDLAGRETWPSVAGCSFPAIPARRANFRRTILGISKHEC